MLGLGLNMLNALWGADSGPPVKVIPDRVNYTKGQYLGYLAPYSADVGGANASLVRGVDYWDALRVRPSFPNKCDIVWKWPDNPPSAGAVVGYLQVTFGNYDGGVPAVPVTPKKVSELSTFAETIGYTMSGDTANATILNEFYCTTASGNPSTKTFEIGHALHESTQAKAWFDTCTVIGTFTDPQGRAWDVRNCGLNPAGARYIAFRSASDYVTGVIDKLAALAWLVTKGFAVSELYINGTALGVEPHKGAGRLQGITYHVDFSSDATVLRREADGTVTILSLGTVAAPTLTRETNGTVTIS